MPYILVPQLLLLKFLICNGGIVVIIKRHGRGCP